MRQSILTLLAMLAWAACCDSVQAQVPYRVYNPPGGQMLPNQLEYFRPQSGVLDQYNQFVAPRENLANQFRSIAARQNRDYESVQNRLQQSDMIREPEAAATGTAAGFMNYSHYFGSNGASSAGTRGQSRRLSMRPYTTSNYNVSTGYGVGASSGMGSGFGGAAGIGSGYRFGR